LASACESHIEARFLYAAAPVLRGVKPAVLVPLHSQCLAAWRLRQSAWQQATVLRTFEIQTRREATLLLLYDEAAIAACFWDPATAALLTKHGYPAGHDREKMLKRLRERFLECDIPHEIGVFLGYPAEDVLGFIENEGKNCLCCRYWKVYHNAARAMEMFRQIDEAHSRAIDILREQKPLDIAVRLLKAA
jgi:hypothetical protein